MQLNGKFYRIAYRESWLKARSEQRLNASPLFQMKLYQGKQIKLEAARVLEPNPLGHPNPNLELGHKYVSLDFKVYVTKHPSQPREKKKKKS